jgi:hypothetical protein
MKCELCQSESADSRLCSVCAEAIQRLLHITTEQQYSQPAAEPGKSRGAAATAGQ